MECSVSSYVSEDEGLRGRFVSGETMLVAFDGARLFESIWIA